MNITQIPFNSQSAGAGGTVVDISSEAPLEGEEPQQASEPDSPGGPSWLKISAVERDALTDLFSKWEDLSPRFMFIFYYRYLLCKNLLLTKAQASPKGVMWTRAAELPKLFTVLKQAGLDASFSALKQERVLANAATGVGQLVDPFNCGVPTSKEDYLLLLDVFDIVIAY